MIQRRIRYNYLHFKVFSDRYCFSGQMEWDEDVQCLSSILSPEYILKYAHLPEIINSKIIKTVKTYVRVSLWLVFWFVTLVSEGKSELQNSFTPYANYLNHKQNLKWLCIFFWHLLYYQSRHCANGCLF